MRIPYAPASAGALHVLLSLALLPSCKQHPHATGPGPTSLPTPRPQGPQVRGDADVILLLSEHEGLAEAQKGLEAALRLPVDLPLPFPRVERHGDKYRVVLARGKYEGLGHVAGALGARARVVPLGEGGTDDVLRLGIVCAEPGGSVPLFAPAGPRLKKGETPREAGRLPHGQVLVLQAEDDDGPEEGGGGVEAERGFARVLKPQPGLVREADVLLPPDCTPRDEDNDDGNGRLLAHGALCLTTRSEGMDGEVHRAALLAVAQNYRQCARFPDAGTFDGFDQNQPGMQFAVENKGAPPHGDPALEIYDVSPQGKLALRARYPGLSRPAYLGRFLVATVADAGGQGIVVLDGEVLQHSLSAVPAPKRIFTLGGPRFVPRSPTVRPAAPTLHDGRVRVTFQQACEGAEERRVRAAARADFKQCIFEVEVDVGTDGKDPRRRCTLNNGPVTLEQPLPAPCR